MYILNLIDAKLKSNANQSNKQIAVRADRGWATQYMKNMHKVIKSYHKVIISYHKVIITYHKVIISYHKVIISCHKVVSVTTHKAMLMYFSRHTVSIYITLCSQLPYDT